MRFPAVLVMLVCLQPVSGIEAGSPGDLAAILPKLKAGDVLKIAPGEYPGGFFVSGIANLTVEALDPADPPHFKGGKEAWHFTRCPGLKVRLLKCSGQSANGINLDDGGRRTEPVEDTLLEKLSIHDIGPSGNFDGIKCSGLKGLRIADCEISGWGGQAIDLVGCSDAVLSNCRISGKDGYSQHTGPLFKGGCSKILMEGCTLINAGERPVQIGGSTGKDYYRPPGANYEAMAVTIRGNRIEGGTCACAFTGARKVEFTGNTIVRPGKWIFRILQETKAPEFLPCGEVTISGNTITFRREQVQTEINVGPGTEPATFIFEGNRWLAEDRPESSKPVLPVPERGGIHGRPEE